MIKAYIKLFWTLLKFRVNKSVIYSMSFWMAFLVDTILFAFHLLAFSTIYQFTDSINGWTLPQMFVFVGTFTMVDSISMGSVFFGILSLPERIRTGGLDLVLTKPVDTQYHISIDGISPGSFFGIIPGGAMVLYGMIQGQFPITIPKVLGFLLLVAMMFMLFYSLMLLVRTMAFFFIRIDGLEQAENSVVEFAFRVPGSAYKGISRLIFMVIIPYGMIATIPAEFLTTGLSAMQWLTTAGIALFFIGAARILFKFGLSHYSSASS